MRDDITIETDIFDHWEVKPHFINPCCFGEDFAAWLRGRLAPLSGEGFHFAEAVQDTVGDFGHLVGETGSGSHCRM